MLKLKYAKANICSCKNMLKLKYLKAKISKSQNKLKVKTCQSQNLLKLIVAKAIAEAQIYKLPGQGVAGIITNPRFVSCHFIAYGFFSESS